MPNTVQYQRLLEKSVVPTERLMKKILGSSAAARWEDVRSFLKEHYDFQPELCYFGLKYGWCYRYRRKGKTLCVLFPEMAAFTVLVVLGKNEIEEVANNLERFNKDSQRTFANAYQYHDGKWMYKRVLTDRDLADLKTLIQIKKKPRDLC